MRVVVRNGNVNKALSILKKKVGQSKKLIDLREKQYYEKPSSKRHKRKKAAVMRERIRHNEQTRKITEIKRGS